MPSQLQFPVPEHSDGIILNKQTTRILTRDAQTSYQAGNTLRFKIQDQKAFDPQSVVLNFQVQTSDARCSIDDWAGSIFRTVSFAFNSNQVERIDYYNRVHNALSSFTVDDGYRASVWGEMEGYYSKVQGSYGNLGFHTSNLGFYEIQAGQLLNIRATGPANEDKQITLTAISGPGETVAASLEAQISGNGDILDTATVTYSATGSFQLTVNNADTAGALVSAEIIPASDPTLDIAGELGFVHNLSFLAGPNAIIQSQSARDFYPLFQSVSDDAFPVIEPGKQYGGLLNSAWKVMKYSQEHGAIDHKVGRQFSLHFDLSGIFGRYRKLFWLPLVNSVDIEILLEQNKTVLNQWGVDISNATYTVVEPELQVEMYTLSQDYVNALSQSMQEEGLTMAFDTYETHLNQLVSNSSHNVIINNRLSSLKGIYCWLYQPHGTSGNENKRLEKTWVQQRRIVDSAQTGVVKLSDYQMFIDGRPIQAHTIKTSDIKHSEALWEVMKCFRLHGDVSVTPHVSRNEYSDRGLGCSVGFGTNVPSDVYKMFDEQHFLFGVDLEKSDLLSGHAVANQIWLQLNWSGSIGENVDLYTVLHYDKNVVIYPGLTFEERI